MMEFESYGSPLQDMSFINSNIKSLQQVSLDVETVSLNLHCNIIKKLENLERYSNLRHLDVSSNQIPRIENLDSLTVLEFLNLSNNYLTSIESLGRLSCLRILDVSYNKITSIGGLSQIKPLKVLYIQGNLIRDFGSVVNILNQLRSLELLVCEEDDSSNPFCSEEGYSPSKIFNACDSLLSLNHKDKFGLDIDLSPPISYGAAEQFLQYLTDGFSSGGETRAVGIATKVSSLVQNVSPVPLKSRPETSDSSNSTDKKRIDDLEKKLALLLEQQNKPKAPEMEIMNHSISSTTSERVPVKKAPVRKPIKTSENKKVESLHQTEASLVKEVEQERNKRWRLEESVSQLKTQILTLKNKLNEEKSLREASADASKSVQGLVLEEKQRNESLQQNLVKVQSDFNSLQSSFDALRIEKLDLEKHLEKTQGDLTQAQNENLKLKASDASKDQENVKKLKTVAKEYEKLQTFTKTQIKQNEQLKAEVEEKEKEIQKRFTENSPELQKIVTEQVKSREAIFVREKEFLEAQIKEWETRYKDLEDEFREALYSEEARFNAVMEKYSTCESNLKKATAEVESLRTQNEKSNQLVQQLTNVAKEQKGRLTELSKTKQEVQEEAKVRTKALEEQLEKTREQQKDYESLKNDKTKLAAHIQAQDSLIEGLRGERKLWEQELAKQGASLAADRGRLELRTETMERELVTLRKQLEKEQDSVKIKTKLIEDQTDTIKKLKDAVVERDSTILKTRDTSLKDFKKLESDLEEETRIRRELQDELELATERKQALKEDLANLRAEFDEKNIAHEDLTKKWKQKSALISQLEIQVKEMKTNWDRKEKNLIHEKDQAIEAANAAVEKLKGLEEKCRIELDKAQEDLEIEKQEVMAIAERKVEQVEDEMREMLKEHEKYKKVMESKFNKLHSAFSDFQSGVE